MAQAKYVYLFSETDAAIADCDGNWDTVRGLLGGKGANLCRMTKINLPVPFGYSISTKACLDYMNNGNSYPTGLWEQCVAALKTVEEKTGKKFGDAANPLLLSSRSGAKFSMPGMLDTVLNLGLNDVTVKAMCKLTNPTFVEDSYRRLIQGFGSVVLGMDDESFEEPLKAYKAKKGYTIDTDMTDADWRALTVEFKAVIQKERGIEFPQDPMEQLKMAIGAVFGSWNSKRAVAYRNKTGVSHSLGTACNIQMMVFGNMADSATGVAFTRNPITGVNKFYGEYLKNAQGEDVVAGIRNCTDVNDMGTEFPIAHKQLLQVGLTLEAEFKNMQDVEFTIENKILYMLQTRDGKRTSRAQVRIAMDMVEEKLIDKDTAVGRVAPADVDILLLPQLDQDDIIRATKEKRCIAKGVNASPGGAVGRIYFSSDKVEEMKALGEDCILCRPFTKPEDVPGFFASKGVLTQEGGATSHAAVVARQFGVPCIVGASALDIDLTLGQVTVGDLIIKEGDVISLDATTGKVYTGPITTVAANFDDEKELQVVLSWADEICKRETARGPNGETMRGLQVWANADYGKDATRARAFGAQGVGLCRTEHMFFEVNRLPIVQQMILAENQEDRDIALHKLLQFQRSDFENIFTAMDGLPVIIRALDPPLHEFLQNIMELTAEVNMAKGQGHPDLTKEHLLEQVEKLHESNPMMGLRGVRLALMFKGVMEMQIRAIMEAACNVQARGIKVIPEIMIPLTSTSKELREVKPKCEEVVAQVFAEKKMQIDYKFGTMVETPRAALIASHLAEYAEFFSFGSNDLTQMTFGISRDDAEREFLLSYVERGILKTNPFQTIDVDGVGRLIHMATKEGRAQRPGMSIGGCGEHFGDPASINLVHGYGLNYVSCSPFRVPSARVSAAHATLNFGKK